MIKEIVVGHEYQDVDSGSKIIFQNGVVPEVGKNGWQNEEVMQTLIDRISFLNKQFPCRENSITITKLEEAQMWQQKRTQDRLGRGVEGEHIA